MRYLWYDVNVASVSYHLPILPSFLPWFRHLKCVCHSTELCMLFTTFRISVLVCSHFVVNQVKLSSNGLSHTKYCLILWLKPPPPHFIILWNENSHRWSWQSPSCLKCLSSSSMCCSGLVSAGQLQCKTLVPALKQTQKSYLQLSCKGSLGTPALIHVCIFEPRSCTVRQQPLGNWDPLFYLITFLLFLSTFCLNWK